MHRPTAFSYAALVVAAAVLTAGMLGCPTTPGGGGGMTFNLPPTPVITSDVIRGVAPLTVQFGSERSTDDGVIVSRQWDFGDGGTSEEISPKHTFESTGDFTVTLTLTDDAGLQASRSVIISVTDAPVAVIAADPPVAESAPAVISFDGSGSFDPDGEIVQYEWEFGDGSREFLQTVTHVFATSGTYRVRLTVTDDKGVTGYAERLIPVGISTPAIEIRVPDDDVQNMVVSTDAPVWVQGIYSVEPGVSHFIRAGLDRDQDQCNAQSVLYTLGDGDTVNTLAGQDDRIMSVAFAPDGTEIATASEDGTVRIYATADGRVLASFSGSGAIRAVAFSPDGGQIVWGERGGDVVLVNADTGDVVRTFSGHSAAVNSVAFAPDGTEILSASNDRHALLWNVADGTVLRDFTHDLGVNAAVFSPAEPAMVATAGEDNVIKIWNTTSGALLRTLTGHTEPVNALAFSPDGMALVSGSDDNNAIAWDPFTGVAGVVYIGHRSDVLAVAFAPDGATLVTGSADWTVRTWNSASGAELLKLQPCRSPIRSVATSPDGTMLLAGVGARNDIPLDTVSVNGNDLNFSVPRGLSLRNVKALGNRDVPEGRYYLWADVSTDRTEGAVRDYANCQVNVIEEFATTVDTDTPVIPLVNDRASVVIPFSRSRQIFDLGPLDAGTKLSVAMMHTPGFDEFYTPEDQFSIMVLDANRNVLAWYEAMLRSVTDDLLDPELGLGQGFRLVPPLYEFVLYTRDTELTIGHTSQHYYVVVDGGQSVKIRIDRGSETVPRRPQRVLLRFDGGVAAAAGQPVRQIPALDAADFNPAWGADETTTIKQVIVQRLRNIYSAYDIEFFTSDDDQMPAPPYLSVYVGGLTPEGYLGIADYVDPRNATATGTGIVYATEIATRGLAGEFTNPVTTDGDVGGAIGNIAAHVVGQLIGLRHTDDPTDVMQVGLGDPPIFSAPDPTVPRILKAALVTQREQLGGLEPIGIQNAPELLEETIGLK